MEKKREFIEKALISAVIACMFVTGVLSFVMVMFGISITNVIGAKLLLGYLLLCLAAWILLMLPEK